MIRICAKDIFGLFKLSRKVSDRLIRVEVLPKAKAAPVMELHAADMGPEFMARASEDTASPSDILP